jgi:hypothetical protein
LSFITRSPKSLEKSVQLMHLSMNVSKYFDWISQLSIKTITLMSVLSSSSTFSTASNNLSM